MGTHRIACITYRAETALCSLVRGPTIDSAAARRLLQDLFVTDADLRPDPAAGVLHVAIHRGSRPAEDRVRAAPENSVTVTSQRCVGHVSHGLNVW